MIVADSMGLSVFVFTQLFSCHVMHFGISEKPSRDFVSPYNNADLISKVSEDIWPAKTLKIPITDNPTVV